MHFFDVVVRISRVEVVHTHQFDAFAIYHDRGGDGSFVDVISVNNSLTPLSVHHNSNTVFVVVFSCSHKYVFLVSSRFLTFLVSTFRSIILHPICSLRARMPLLRFFHLSELISFFFFSTMTDSRSFQSLPRVQ